MTVTEKIQRLLPAATVSRGWNYHHNSGRRVFADQMDGVDTCRRCHRPFSGDLNEATVVLCPHCGARQDVEISITFDEQEEARRIARAVNLGGKMPPAPLMDFERAEVHDGRWVLVADGVKESPADHIATSLDALLGFIERTKDLDL